jgi:histidine triad (HIT) family protein
MTTETYDPNNIFSKILRGEIASHKIYEDGSTYAFMDVMPQVDGHCLVVPKQGSRNLLDADPQVLSQLMLTVQRVAKAAVEGMGADGFQIRQFNETAAGQTVFHLHFHILPLKAGDTIRPHIGKMADQALLARHAEMIRSKLT